MWVGSMTLEYVSYNPRVFQQIENIRLLSIAWILARNIVHPYVFIGMIINNIVLIENTDIVHNVLFIQANTIHCLYQRQFLHTSKFLPTKVR